MSGLGEAASIAGIIGVAGQAISSASALYTFCKTYRHVEPDIEHTTNEVERLSTVLLQLERLVPTLSAAACSPATIRAAEYQIGACKNDLADWSRTVDGLDLKNARVTKRMKEKLKIAADRGFFYVHSDPTMLVPGATRPSGCHDGSVRVSPSCC